MDSALGKTDQATQGLRITKVALKSDKAERSALAKNIVAAKKDAVDDAMGNVQATKQFTDGCQGFVEGVFKLNRSMESGFEMGVLGVHMRQQMQELAGSWGKAVTAQKSYIDQLAKGYADPQMAADAGRYVHDTLGQYDRFSPRIAPAPSR
jgi:hypothetical protein